MCTSFLQVRISSDAVNVRVPKQDKDRLKKRVLARGGAIQWTGNEINRGCKSQGYLPLKDAMEGGRRNESISTKRKRMELET